MDAGRKRQLAAHLARLADGDRSALAPVFAVLRPFVLAYCERALAGSPDAEDATHEALVRIFANAHRYDATRDPIPWVLAFAVNASRTVRRRHVRRRESEQAELPSDANQL